jgi:hypothetical protein
MNRYDQQKHIKNYMGSGDCTVIALINAVRKEFNDDSFNILDSGGCFHICLKNTVLLKTKNYSHFCIYDFNTNEYTLTQQIKDEIESALLQYKLQQLIS